MVNLRSIVALAFCFTLIGACKKDTINQPDKTVTTTPPKDSTASSVDTIQPIITFNFDAKVNTLPLTVNSKWYTNTSGDSFTVTKFNYYISNVKLKRADGTFFSEPESYHLIKHAEGINSFSFTNVPVGDYTAIEFLIGVDSLRNVSGAQTGALDPGNLMFWEWNTGYIFFKLEGDFRTPVQPEKGGYAIHIGGFKGKFSCLQKCSFALSTPVAAKKNKRSSLFYNVNLEELFVNPQTIGFDYYYANINEKMFHDISVNYSDMFTVNRVEN